MTRFVTSGQRGFSFIGFLFVAAVLAVTGVVVAQIIPTAIEYQAVLKAAQKAAEGNTVVEVRSIFDKAAAIDNISSVSGKDIDVTKENDKVVVSFAYQREIHLAGPAYLTMKYAGRSK
ncbi:MULTISPECIES: DUF4845 domain-containing protein [Rhodoferax]|uniref:DUF4845 domain-containing protein n=1 Tax=Rhodoferax fermentans TaxID=28066 RepID=A0A1T1AQB0_RHOFE|nr:MULTISPECIES: DUF4845 domain-containing protein [Rhodoferax]MBK1683532.1 DUF4845 domain-containing protein [Rhodoferax fermentans]OOV06280.1 DUF4845 domain-containing protein [Rhodoferax fermentans]